MLTLPEGVADRVIVRIESDLGWKDRILLLFRPLHARVEVDCEIAPGKTSAVTEVWAARWRWPWESRESRAEARCVLLPQTMVDAANAVPGEQVGSIACTADDIHNYAATLDHVDCYVCGNVHKAGEHFDSTIHRVAAAIWTTAEESNLPMYRVGYDTLTDVGRAHYRALAVSAINAALWLDAK